MKSIISASKLETASLLGAFAAATAINHIVLRWCAAVGVSTAQILVFRGLTCAIWAVLVGFGKRESFRPSQLGIQITRLITAGSALSAFAASYQYLSATSVSLISRLDLPIMILFGSAFGARGRAQQRILAACALSTLSGYLLWSHDQEPLVGYLLALAGVAALILGYLFLKQSARAESPAIVTLTPAIACIVAGACIESLSPSPLSLKLPHLVGLAISGTMMFLMYRLSCTIYLRLPITEAQIPTLLVPALSLPMEAWVFGQPFSPTHMVVVCSIIGLTMAALFLRGEDYGKEITATSN